MPVAVLFVTRPTNYFGLPGVELWDERRDARRYDGPHRVIAHPPCARWGRYWNGGPSASSPRKLGDDGGCFAAALSAVRRFGGVLEHPQGSHAWRHFGLRTPPHTGGWIHADPLGGWTCCVYQGHYGHDAQKATWLYASGVKIRPLEWGKPPRPFDLDETLSQQDRDVLVRKGGLARLAARKRMVTPIPFRDLLLSMAGYKGRLAEAIEQS